MLIIIYFLLSFINILAAAIYHIAQLYEVQCLLHIVWARIYVEVALYLFVAATIIIAINYITTYSPGHFSAADLPKYTLSLYLMLLDIDVYTFEGINIGHCQQ